MSAAPSTDTVPPSPTAAKSKKPKKKKSAAAKKAAYGDQSKANGVSVEQEDVLEEEEGNGPAAEITATETKLADTNGSPEQATLTDEQENVVTVEADKEGTRIEPPQEDSNKTSTSTEDTQARLDAMASEREALRNEVASLRKSLEAFQGKGDDASDLRKELEDTKRERDEAEQNYENLRGRVTQIKQQLGERLKSDAAELTQCRSRIEELEEQNETLTQENKAREDDVTKLSEGSDERSKELSSLRNRLTLSQENWNKEREELLQRESYAKDEFEQAKQAMQDWEILAMDERSIRENLSEKVAELEEQVTTHREARDRLESERQSQTLTVDGLQRALQELQEARKKELREMVETSQSQLSDLRSQLEKAVDTATQATNAQDASQKELERVKPFESEVKEKNLLIGKLRHQAVILNDHLTKALRQLKKGKPEDAIDRQLVTNHFLHFLSIERSDPRKFQVLQVMASLLEWTDEQREQAGLSRPGASNVSLRTPLAPFNRVPSTPQLSSENLGQSPSSPRAESLGGLFSEFLEKESHDGKADSRATSVSGSMKP